MRWLCLLALAACVERKPPVDYGDPTDLNTPTTVAGITAYVVSPRVTEVLTTSQVELVVAAWSDDAQPLRVTVAVDGGPSVLVPGQGADGPGQRYVTTLPLLHGYNNVRIRAGTPDGARVHYLDYRVRYDADAAGIRLSLLAPGCDGVPIPAGVTASLTVCVRGQISARDGDVGGREVAVATEAQTATVVTDEAGQFETLVTLAPDTRETIRATVSESTARLAITQDSTPPQVSAGDGFTTDAEAVTLSGTASDDVGLAALRLEGTAGGDDLAVGATWSGEVLLTPGANPFRIHARDLAGNQASAEVVVVRNRLIVLRPPPAPADGIVLPLDRAALASLLPDPADQKAIEMVRVPLRPALLATLAAVRDPVASGVDTSGWGTAEWNLWRLLNMTPDNADLRGTSVERLLALADAVGIPKARVLADLFDSDVLTTFLADSVLVDVLLAQLIASHPNMRDGMGNLIVDDDGNLALSLTMHDALQDLATLAPRFGRCSGSSFANTVAVPACAGAHPGFLTATSSSIVFEPGFLLTVPVRSNLTQYDGVSAAGTAAAPGATKDYLFRLEGDQVLEFDFLSDRFSVVGLVDEPKVDLSFLITEHTSGGCGAQPCLKAGTVRLSGADPDRPGFHRGNSAVWSAQPFHLERIVAEAAYRQLHAKFPASYARTFSYDAGSIDDAAVIDWARGWVTITTSGGIGEPPPPLYAWDLLHEVGQVRLHDGGLAEGQGTTKFTLRQLPIGLTADQLIAKMRPTLQAKEAELSERLVGSGGLATSGVDFYFVPGFLFFRAAADQQAPYPYSKPGFFADAALTTKVSVAGALPGTTDTVHEKIVAAAGTFYFQAPGPDQVERIYELVVLAAEPTRVTVRVSPVTP